MMMQEHIRKLFENSDYFQLSDELVADYAQFQEKLLFKNYLKYSMEKEKVEQGRLDELKSPFPNGKKGTEYSCKLTLPEGMALARCEGLDNVGLQCQQEETSGSELTISGTPNAAGDFEIVLHCSYEGWVQGKPLLSRKFHLIVNPDPCDLWVNRPTDREMEYFKEDEDSIFLQGENSLERVAKNLLAASLRGRSHGHEGKPRDDHFQVLRNDENGWHIVAVADGAGSAPFSRQGSKIACETVVQLCAERIGNEEMEACIRNFGLAPDEQAFRSQLERAAYSVLGQAAFAAYKAIQTEAQAKNRNKKEYATTLLLALCKRYDFGWFVASFGVGDGGMAILGQKQDEPWIRLLAEPDEGEFGGQTRFLTMDDIFSDYEAVASRIYFEIVPDFTAILLMTDGVSDAKFETDANLHNPQKWQELWQDLHKAVPLHGNSEDGPQTGIELTKESDAVAQEPDYGEVARKKLLEWLNFWSPGNHDDRTLALVY